MLCLLVPGTQFSEVGEKVRGGVEKVGQGKEKTFSEGNIVELLSGSFFLCLAPTHFWLPAFSLLSNIVSLGKILNAGLSLHLSPS